MGLTDTLMFSVKKLETDCANKENTVDLLEVVHLKKTQTQFTPDRL